MAAVALAAVGLALTRGMNPMHLGAFGPLVAILLWLFYTGVIERRRLEGFHYATAVVTVLASGFLARQIALVNFSPLGQFAAHLNGAAIFVLGFRGHDVPGTQSDFGRGGWSGAEGMVNCCRPPGSFPGGAPARRPARVSQAARPTV